MVALGASPVDDCLEQGISNAQNVASITVTHVDAHRQGRTGPVAQSADGDAHTPEPTAGSCLHRSNSHTGDLGTAARASFPLVIAESEDFLQSVREPQRILSELRDTQIARADTVYDLSKYR